MYKGISRVRYCSMRLCPEYKPEPHYNHFDWDYSSLWFAILLSIALKQILNRFTFHWIDWIGWNSMSNFQLKRNCQLIGSFHSIGSWHTRVWCMKYYYFFGPVLWNDLWLIFAWGNADLLIIEFGKIFDSLLRLQRCQCFWQFILWAVLENILNALQLQTEPSAWNHASINFAWLNFYGFWEFARGKSFWGLVRNLIPEYTGQLSEDYPYANPNSYEAPEYTRVNSTNIPSIIGYFTNIFW